METKKFWDMYRVRQFCINHDYFCRGSIENYSSMLNFVNTHEPTNENILIVAAVILVNSKVVDLDTIVAECHEFAKTVEKECVWNA